MKRKDSKNTGAKRSDPLRAYRFTSLIRHLLSAFYGVMLGYAVMAGNAVINYFVGVLTAIMAYIFIKTLAGKFLVKVRLVPRDPDVVRKSPGIIVAKIRNYSPFAFPVSYLFVKDSAFPEGQRIFFFVRPFANMSMAFPLCFDHCGSYPLRPESVRLISAGGMVWAKALLSKKKQGRISVIPETLPAVVDQNRGEGSGDVSTSVKPAISATDSVFVRQYAPGDDPRFIHWKRSASREDWLLRSFYQEGEHNYIVFLDARINGGLNRDMSKYADPFSPDEELSKKLSLADKLSAAAVSISAALTNDGIPFNFVYPVPKAGDDPELAAIFCDSNTALTSIGRIAGTVNFAPFLVRDNAAETANSAEPYSVLPGQASEPFDRDMISSIASLVSLADNGISIIRVCAGSEDKPVGGSAGVMALTNGTSPAAAPSSGLEQDRRIMLSAAEFSVRGMPEAECYAEQFPGAYIITVEVKP